MARYVDKSDAFLRKLDSAMDRAVGQAGEFVAQGIQDVMPGQGASVLAGTGGSTGVRGKYTASNPGNPPGVRSNTLKGSIASTRTNEKYMRRVGTNVTYARIHEFGGIINHPGGTGYIVTDDGAKFISEAKAIELASRGIWVGKTKPHQINMPPRPFMSTGLAASRKGAFAAFARSLKRSFA